MRHLNLIFSAMLLSVVPLHADSPPTKPQQLTSPDQVPEGLAKSDWSSIRAAYEAGRHAFQPVEGGWQARNPGQQWTTKFDGRAFLAQPKDADWQWGLEFKSYGFGERQTEVGGTPAVLNEGQRLSYQWDHSVEEWFVNDQRGLEHGFIITQRPATDEPSSSTSSPLSFTLATRGSLRPTLSADAQTVHFRDASHASVLNYSGLKVWDADGKILSSRFEAAGENQIRLLVDEVGARYPLTIDPIAQQAYLKAGNNGPATRESFGYSVAISGDTVVVGAFLEGGSATGVNGIADDNAASSGAAYVFVRNGSTWSQQAYLKASNTGQSDLFGYSVAVSGDTVVIGAYLEDSSTTGVNSTPDKSATDSGAAYVFVRSGSSWSPQAYLKASNAGAGDQFGISVAVSGDTVVVGARLEWSSTTGVNSIPNESAGGSGAVYAFVRSGSTWTQQAYLKASNTGAGDQFGYSLALSGETLVVGATEEDSSKIGVNSIPNEAASGSGAAYVFVRNGSIWSQQAYLKASNTGGSDKFGFSVAVSGDTVVVGAYWEDSSTTGVNSTPTDTAANAGAAYVFARNGSTWSQQAYLKASNTRFIDQFGHSVAVSGDTVVVGANFEDSSTTGVNSTPDQNAGGSGAAYVFVRSGSTWSQQAYIKASNTGAADQFGTSVAVSGDTVLVGARDEDSSTTGVNSTANEGALDSGAAYVFTRSGSIWSQQSYVKASNTPQGESGADDLFGGSVAVAGDTVVVGAIGEDSSTTGVNSTPNDSAGSSGAAYVFTRTGTTWSQQAYLKASNTGLGDTFGTSVAVFGDTVIVGAAGEDSSTTGVNSTPNESAMESGAAYVFVRSGSIWSQQAYLKASNTGGADAFGTSVAVSGDSVVIGASFEDSSTTGVNGASNESAADSGAVYIFTRSGTTWSQQAYLKASNTGASDRFGGSVAVSGQTVVVGAVFEDSITTGVNSTPNENAGNSGAAYVFTRSGTTWSQQAYLKASYTRSFEQFGCSVAVSGATVVVGAYLEDSSTTGVNSTPNYTGGAPFDSGAAYIFTRNGTTWSQQAYLKASNTGAGDQFGLSVAVSGDTVVVGADREDSSTTGVNSTPNEASTNTGAAYVFTRSGTTWSQQAYLKASNTGVDNRFGGSVAVSSDTLVVGAIGESSNTTGVNSIPNEGALFSGAAYIFSGLGPPPAIAVSGNATPITNGDATPTTADFTNFGTVAAASGSIAKTFTISNSGTAALNLTGSPQVALSGSHAGDFSVTLEPTSPVTGAGGSTTFTVTFDPSAIGLRTATVSIANDDATKNPFTFSIQGTGLNTAPSITSNGGAATATINVAENSVAVTIVTTTDADLPAQTLTYSITGGADAAKFSIGSSSGVLTFISAANFESPTDAGANNIYNLTVTVTDNGAPTLSDSQAISVTITNVNEAPTALALNATSLTENLPANTTVGNLSSTDPDAGDAFLYSLVSGSGSTDNAAFTITGDALKINSPPVFATQSSYAIRIRSTDSGGLFFEMPFTITITSAAAVFTNWATTAGLTGVNAELTAIPFNDGVKNLLKYAFNMNAAGPDVSVVTSSGGSGLPLVTVDTSGEEPVLRVVFLRRKGSGLLYTAERATTLEDFGPMTGNQTVTSINAEWERVTVVETSPPVAGNSGYARVRVTLP